MPLSIECIQHKCKYQFKIKQLFLEKTKKPYEIKENAISTPAINLLDRNAL